MAKRTLEILTESMFYVLMSFMGKEMCGIEIAEFVEEDKGQGQAWPRYAVYNFR